MSKYGYYLPAQGTLAGEPELAQKAERFYRDTLGLDARHADRYDGASIYTRPDGQQVIRVALQNMFQAKLDVQVHDYPFQEYGVCGECGGTILHQVPDGDFLTIRYRGNIISAPMPSSIKIPKCNRCGQIYLGYSQADQIAKEMGGELIAWQ